MVTEDNLALLLEYLSSSKEPPSGLIEWLSRDEDVIDKLLKLVECASPVFKDPLTGLRVHFLFERYLLETIEWYLRAGNSLHAICSDLQCLKVVNDCLGRIFGDLYLKAAGKAIMSSVRSVDYSFRLSDGADEFVIFIRDSEKTISKVIERLRENFKREFHDLAEKIYGSYAENYEDGKREVMSRITQGIDSRGIKISAEKEGSLYPLERVLCVHMSCIDIGKIIGDYLLNEGIEAIDFRNNPYLYEQHIDSIAKILKVQINIGLDKHPDSVYVQQYI